MEIIKKGIINRKAKCKFCGTIFLYKASDIQRELFDNFVKCPICYKRHYISFWDKKIKKNN